MQKNPFSISFGNKPQQYINRDQIIDAIFNDLLAEQIQNRCFMITGVRGSGKTVALTTIENRLRDDDEWIVVGLNSERDMLQSLVAKLYDSNKFLKDFFKAGINLSAFGIGVSPESKPPVADIESALEIILKEIKKRNKRLLVTVDEVYSSKYVREFTAAFQILLRQDLPVFLVMAGLYDNIHRLEDEKNLTFLYRAPKFYMEPLSILAIQNSYKKIFKIDEVSARQMAELTKGYAFAYQVLGKYIWESKDHQLSEEVLDKYDETLSSYVYEKLWSELSNQDRWYLAYIAEHETIETGRLLKLTEKRKNEFSQYRARLSNKGLIDTSERGRISIKLPRFSNFVHWKTYSIEDSIE